MMMEMSAAAAAGERPRVVAGEGAAAIGLAPDCVMRVTTKHRARSRRYLSLRVASNQVVPMGTAVVRVDAIGAGA